MSELSFASLDLRSLGVLLEGPDGTPLTSPPPRPASICRQYVACYPCLFWTASRVCIWLQADPPSTTALSDMEGQPSSTTGPDRLHHPIGGRGRLRNRERGKGKGDISEGTILRTTSVRVELPTLPTHSIACRLPLTVRLLNCFPVLQFVISSTTSKHLPWHPNQARNLLSLVFS